MRGTYLDSSAIVKLATREAESTALTRHLRRRRPYLASAIARTEVPRAVAPKGPDALREVAKVLARMELLRVSDRTLEAAASLPPMELRSLDAIHLATAQLLGDLIGQLITYDTRMAEAAEGLGFRVVAPF